jgi:hypothetical protein
MKKTTVAKKKRQGSSLKKQVMLGAVKLIAEKVVAEKVKNNGRAPWGFKSKLLEEGRLTFPAMSRRTIHNYIERLEKEKTIGYTILIDSSSNNISSIWT